MSDSHLQSEMQDAHALRRGEQCAAAPSKQDAKPKAASVSRPGLESGIRLGSRTRLCERRTKNIYFHVETSSGEREQAKNTSLYSALNVVGARRSVEKSLWN